MASALSSRCLSFSPPPSTRFPSKCPKSLAFFIHRNPRNRPKYLFPQISSKRFRNSMRVAQTGTKAINGDEENQVLVDQSENKGEQEDLPSMKVLVQAYKKAIVDGDEKRVSEIEYAICLVENEKNSLSLKFGELNTEITSQKDKFLRLKADLENYRKRTEKDRLSSTSNVQGEVIESLLLLVDSFEKAKQHLKPETEKEKKIDTSYQGIYKQFVEIMRSLNVSVIGTVGKPFDPSIHEAVAREESQKFKEGIVTQEVRRGFLLGDRLLRPATVKVSAGPGPGKVPLASEPAEDEQVPTSSA